MSVELRPVTKENWVEVIRLKLSPEQEGFVAPNVDSIAESKFEPHYEPRAIYESDKIVGFLMYCPETETEEKGLYWLFRFMIDFEHQQKGIGRAALSLAISEMSKRNCSKINVLYSPKNTVAAKLYSSLGFKTIGIADDGDIIAQKKINQQNAP
ncbi:MAG: GNAT family N-acetyltransferase [Coleofasciculus sp. Co-bin14]|nr:GNAT family N-acetyltransferase [Coleofasciculus sp. Co-bin14]